MRFYRHLDFPYTLTQRHIDDEWLLIGTNKIHSHTFDGKWLVDYVVMVWINNPFHKCAMVDFLKFICSFTFSCFWNAYENLLNSWSSMKMCEFDRFESDVWPFWKIKIHLFELNRLCESFFFSGTNSIESIRRSCFENTSIKWVNKIVIIIVNQCVHQLITFTSKW